MPPSVKVVQPEPLYSCQAYVNADPVAVTVNVAVPDPLQTDDREEGCPVIAGETQAPTVTVKTLLSAEQVTEFNVLVAIRL